MKWTQESFNSRPCRFLWKFAKPENEEFKRQESVAEDLKNVDYISGFQTEGGADKAAVSKLISAMVKFRGLDIDAEKKIRLAEKHNCSWGPKKGFWWGRGCWWKEFVSF